MPKPVPRIFDHGLTTKMHFLPIPGVKLFGVVWRYHNAPFFFSQKNMHSVTEDAQAGVFKTKYNWALRETGHLWWTTTANTLKAKKTVRTFCSRRLRCAFVQSLAAHGFDSKGWSSRGKEHGSLLGTVEIHPFETLLTAKFEAIATETDNFVRWIETQQTSKKSRDARDELARAERSPDPAQTAYRYAVAVASDSTNHEPRAARGAREETSYGEGSSSMSDRYQPLSYVELAMSKRFSDVSTRRAKSAGKDKATDRGKPLGQGKAKANEQPGARWKPTNKGKHEARRP